MEPNYGYVKGTGCGSRFFFFLRIFLTSSFIVLLISHGNAQKNIVAVPTSYITDKGKSYFQEQILISNQLIIFSTLSTFGLGREFEFGLELDDVTLGMKPGQRGFLFEGSQNTNPFILVNAQKGFVFSEIYRIGIGTKVGYFITQPLREARFANFSYFNNRITDRYSKNIVNIGLYYLDPTYAGPGNNVGYMLAYQRVLIKDMLGFAGEYVSGNNDFSYCNLGLQYSLNDIIQFGISAQLPSINSGNKYGIVLQIVKN